jgi:hypothetical protein
MANRRGQEIKKTQTANADSLAELQAPTWGNARACAEQPLWSEILPGLWQGGTDDWDVMDVHVGGWKKRPARITRSDFDTVVTLYGVAKPVDWHVRELRFGMWDSNLSDVDFADIFDIVEMAHNDWLKGKKVLIRCQAGWNRSGLITALVLIREGYSAAEAIRLIRKQRSEFALCNPDFVEWLVDGTNPEDWRGAFYQDSYSWGLSSLQD